MMKNSLDQNNHMASMMMEAQPSSTNGNADAPLSNN
jgi:hypothetical protein